MKSFLRLLVMGVVLILLVSCSQETPVLDPVETEVTRIVEVEATRLVNVEVTQLVEVTRIIEVEKIVTSTPAPTPELVVTTAEDVVIALMAAGLPVGEYEVYTAETDPNELLGRPGGYLGKVNFRDARLGVEDPNEFDTGDGGSIEIYPDAAGAENRAEYIETITQEMPTLIEYHFLNQGVLLRLSKRLTPDQAQEYADALSLIEQ